VVQVDFASISKLLNANHQARWHIYEVRCWLPRFISHYGDRPLAYFSRFSSIVIVNDLLNLQSTGECMLSSASQLQFFCFELGTSRKQHILEFVN
jgi:hypothetical protein